MIETSLQKAERVAVKRLGSIPFRGIDFHERVDEEVKSSGGAMTVNKVIYLDPSYVVEASEMALAFVLAHEYRHATCGLSDDEFLWRGQQRINLMRSEGIVAPEISLEKLAEVAGQLVQQESEWEADDFAMRTLFDSDWSREQTMSALSDFKSLQEWYTRKNYSEPQPVIDSVEQTWVRLLRRCDEIWEEKNPR